MMRSPKKYIAWIFAIALLVSCGMVRDKFGRLPGGYTTVNLSLPQGQGYEDMAWPAVSGGLMAYIVGINGNPFSTTIAMDLQGGSAANPSIQVPNGPYRIYALAWAGPNKLEGQIGCGASVDYVFDGGTKDVTLNIAGGAGTTNCNYTGGSSFANSGYNTNNTTTFPTLTVYACSGLSTGVCATVSGSFSTTASVRLVLNGYVRNADVYDPSLPGIQTTCYTGGGSFATLARVPPGSSVTGSDRFLGLTVEFFSNGNSTCSGTPVRKAFFPAGYANPSPNVSAALTTPSLYVDLGP